MDKWDGSQVILKDGIRMMDFFLLEFLVEGNNIVTECIAD